MITIKYPLKLNAIETWKVRLDQIFLKYKLIEQDPASTPSLIDGNTFVEGIPAIETYLDSLEKFVEGWYEDRCDKYDFDPDTHPSV